MTVWSTSDGNPPRPNAVSFAQRWTTACTRCAPLQRARRNMQHVIPNMQHPRRNTPKRQNVTKHERTEMAIDVSSTQSERSSRCSAVPTAQSTLSSTWRTNVQQ
jgi:hypothetical protein